MKELQRIKGTQDILPEESYKWQFVEAITRRVMHRYHYLEMRTPVFEMTELFARGIGQLTDIVSKEMYTFADRGKKSLTLKPEMTAAIMRAFIEHKMYARQPVSKFYYIAPLFRQENPQAGRQRQFHQFGAELIGSSDARADAEIIDLAMQIFTEIGLNQLQLRLNSVGDADSRKAYREILKDYIRPRLDQYCPDCQRRFEDNPMRILDCKVETCTGLNQEAPKITYHLNQASQAHYSQVKDQLTRLGIPFTEDSSLVRGLDYYTHTVFEVTSGALGAQNAICGGGRYDLLAEELGGQPAPAVGFAAGMERTIMVAEAQGLSLGRIPAVDVFLAALGEQAQNEALIWLKKLRATGLHAETDFQNRSVKAQMREANRLEARFVILMGDNELERGVLTIKDMQQSSQEEIAAADVPGYLQQKTGNGDDRA